jgi:peptidylprolyl isomerase
MKILALLTLLSGAAHAADAPAPGTTADAPALPVAPEDVAAPPSDAEFTRSGLATKVLRPGDGSGHPSPYDVVLCHYSGWTTDGELFDSSVVRGEPARFPLTGVVAGWTEGVPLMTPGEIRRFWIPESLAYKGQPGRPAGMLVFDIELISFEHIEIKPTTPKDVKKIPPSAQVSPTGLAWRVLEPGSGNEHPRANSRVLVHYSGWTTNGKLFDSSLSRGEPMELPLDMVIPGWTEGVQLMVPGERRRFWIPKKLAYNGRPGAPKGMLVFDVELIDILD